eukprot:TRINITY_DN10478_c0_g1_i1.p1 TRINITY_DN10478_c0_g1~~TRINITY_DN10478_c0_g1_i1.p1  ORF type:complete len:389 (+),score=63.15 TRINITY_DN10478_c0_g1_i1:133-1299(+)
MSLFLKSFSHLHHITQYTRSEMKSKKTTKKPLVKNRRDPQRISEEEEEPDVFIPEKFFPSSPLVSIACRNWKNSEIDLVMMKNKNLNVNKSVDARGWTALHWYATFGNIEAVKLLIEKYGADPNIQSYLGSTSVVRAISHIYGKRRRELLTYLISKGGNLNIRCVDGWNCLHMVIDTNLTDFVDEFLANGVEIDAQDKKGSTPLIFAVERGYNETVRMLLDRGANPNIRNKKNFTALDVAVYTDNQELVTLLKAKTEPVQSCRACGQDSVGQLKKCSRCFISYYCSPQCSKSHWAEHKPNCKAPSALHKIPSEKVIGHEIYMRDVQSKSSVYNDMSDLDIRMGIMLLEKQSPEERAIGMAIEHQDSKRRMSEFIALGKENFYLKYANK